MYIWKEEKQGLKIEGALNHIVYIKNEKWIDCLMIDMIIMDTIIIIFKNNLNSKK